MVALSGLALAMLQSSPWLVQVWESCQLCYHPGPVQGSELSRPPHLLLSVNGWDEGSSPSIDGVTEVTQPDILNQTND